MADKPIKIGFLKEDLYSCFIEHDNEDYDCFITRSIVDEILEKISKSFHIAFPKGTKFECHLDDSEELELWFIEGNLGGISYDSDWAEDHLIDIQEIK